MPERTIAQTAKVEVLHARALRLLQEMEEQSGKAFAIAGGGRAYTNDADGNRINEMRTFEAIQDILGEAEAQNALERTINELAALVSREVCHD